MAKAKREIWDGTGLNYPLNSAIPDLVRRLEDYGFDGKNFGDSQNRYCDPFVCMGLAAAHTKTLKLSTGVVNPVTRHPALMANVVGTVQLLTGGRAVLGISRGDSALAHIGMAPAPPDVFERYVSVVQRYLAGVEVSFEEVDAAMGGARKDMRSAEALHIGKVPKASRMLFLPGDMPKVPVDIFATGPRLISIGARLADRLTFAVGAHPPRLRWALDLAREERRKAGLDPNGMSYGALIPVGLDNDLDRARKRIAGVVAVSTRFSVMHGKPIGPVDNEDAPVFKRLHDGYDMTRHAVATSDQAGLIPDWFMDKHAVIGQSGAVTDRLIELFELGIDRVALLLYASQHGAQQEIDAVYERFAKEVLPAVKAG